MAPHSYFLCILLLFSLSFHGTYSAMTYKVFNEAAKTPGGIKFTEKIGIPYTKEIMGKINNFIWTTVFQQNSPADRKPYDTVEIFIRDFKEASGIAWLNKINISTAFMDIYPNEVVKWHFTALLYHEMTHTFQWYGENRTPPWLFEGIADYTKLRANYMQPGFAKPGQGDRWDQGYDITARFLEYCDRLTPSFVAKLNKMMRKTYDVAFFQNLTGKPIEQLWKDYKAKYGQKI